MIVLQGFEVTTLTYMHTVAIGGRDATVYTSPPPPLLPITAREWPISPTANLTHPIKNVEFVFEWYGFPPKK